MQWKKKTYFTNSEFNFKKAIFPTPGVIGQISAFPVREAEKKYYVLRTDKKYMKANKTTLILMALLQRSRAPAVYGGYKSTVSPDKHKTFFFLFKSISSKWRKTEKESAKLLFFSICTKY